MMPASLFIPSAYPRHELRYRELEQEQVQGTGTGTRDKTGLRDEDTVKNPSVNDAGSVCLFKVTDKTIWISWKKATKKIAFLC